MVNFASPAQIASVEGVAVDPIRLIARDCGRLSTGYTDAARYVEGVGERIVEHLKALHGLEEVMAKLLED